MNKMTKRARYLAALRGEAQGALVWAPNFDYWLSVNTARGTVPEPYAGMSRNDIVRSIGASIWNRAGALRCELDPSIGEEWESDGAGVVTHRFTTPVGMIYEQYRATEDEYSTKALTKHFVTDLDALRVMTYVVNGTRYVENFEPTQRAVAETGEDGVVLNSVFCVPFIQFAKTDAGYIDGLYLWHDETEKVEELLDAYTRRNIAAMKLVRNSPADIIACDDNMDEVMISPSIFRRYAIDYYQQCKDVLKGSGKLFEAHWCGRTQHLLPMVHETGLDIVEAIVTRPMADTSLDDALNALQGKVTLQGGIPSVYMCPGIISQKDFEAYMTGTVRAQRGRAGFVVGMSDNVPPDADFSRVEQVAQLIK